MNICKKSIVLGVVSVCAVVAQADAGADDLSRIYLGSWPSVSGDGSKFAFEWNDRIWIASTTGGVARCVTPGSSKSMFPVMSPDGRRVAFTSNREGCDNHVFEADAETGRVRQLSYHSQQTLPYRWTHGGSNLLCVVCRDQSGPHCERIALLPTDRRADVRVLFDSEGTEPALSPDGKTLLFRMRGDDAYRKRLHSKVTPEAGEIWSYDLEKGTFAQLVANRCDARNPAWAPDGRGFYYLNAVGGVRNVYYREIGEKGEGKRMTDFNDDHAFQLSVSADGKTALFRQKFDFWRLDLATPGAKPERIMLVPETGYQSRPPTRRRWYDSCWNNDEYGSVAFCDNGMQIAFTTGGDLYVMDTVMREPQLVHGSTLTHERDCAFTPDGKALYYTSDRGDGTDIWRATRADPSKAWWENRAFVRTRVISDDEIRRDFSLSPDGAMMAWSGLDGRLAFATTNGVVRARGPRTTKRGSYSWSPDGRFVAAQIANKNVQNDVFIVSTEENEKAWPLTCNYLFDGYPTWSPDGQVIAWLSVRPDIASGDLLSYVYLDEAAEERELLFAKLEEARKKTEEKKPDEKKCEKKEEGKKEEPAVEKRPVPFEKLIDRARVTRVRICAPTFADDSRTLAFTDGNVTKSVRLPNDLEPKQVFRQTGDVLRWTKKSAGDSGTMLWAVGHRPAHGDKTFGFTTYQTTDIADYQELAFRTAWGRMRDTYYDTSFHGENWLAIRDKYLPYARNARAVSVYTRVIRMMLGELDSSHVGYYSTNLSRKEWEISASVHAWSDETRHLGIRFDPAHRGAGWKIRDVVKDSPADRREYGLKPGDIVERVDGVAVSSDTDPTEVLNGPSGKKVTVTVNGRDIRLATIGYGEVRRLLTESALDANRELVHQRSGGRFGYLNIAKMDSPSLSRFRHEAYVEGFGRDGLVIDVRTNRGGYTADRMFMTLFGAMHNYWNARGIDLEYNLGYSERPLWYKPIVVLCSEETCSNAEIFSHGVQQLRRGKLVGRETGGNVIARNEDDILDYGSILTPFLGVFLLDGRDMEFHGAKPEVEVDNVPADLVKGIDRQLETALGVLDEDVKAWKKQHPAVVPACAQ